MKVLKLLVFIFGLSLHAFSQLPTINAFPIGSATVAPYSGATGTTMIITGTNFTGATAVSFGGTAASSFTVVSSTQITAVVAGGTSGRVMVTTPVDTVTRAGFTYLPLSRIITTFGGYWSSTTASANATNPDDSHDLLGFGYNSIFYSTGVNDATLTSNGVSFTAGNYRALPVAAIIGTAAGGSTVLIASASKADGSATTASVAGVASSTIKSVMTDGVRGLNLGTGVTNLPKSAILTFDIFSIDDTKISDAEPDILITQIADPQPGNDTFQFVNSTGVLVGNTVSQNMTVLTSFGTYILDLFSFTAGAPYNTATPSAMSSTNTSRSIRVVAFKLSDFGITAGNVGSVKGLKITPSGNSDYAFIAYNANAINIPPNITKNDGATISSVSCNGTAVLSVIGSAASGGTLSYSWEQSTNDGTTWAAISNGGNFSGATTSSLSIINPVNGYRYRAIVTEVAAATTTNTSDEFTLAVSAPSVGGSLAGSTTVCSGTNSTVLTLSGQTGNILRWESSTDNFSTFTPISNTTANFTASNLSVTTQYRAVVHYNSCPPATSSTAVVTVTSGQWIGGASGNWNVAANWCGGVPTLSTNVTIPASSVVNIQSANAVANTVIIATTASLVISGSYNLNIATGGSITNNGTFDASASTGIVTFSGNGAVTGTTTFNNIQTYGALNFGTSSTIAGEFTLQTGGSVTGNSATYQCPGSTLTYNTGGVFSRSLEWLNVSSGKGYPSNVRVKNNTTINFPAAGAGYICNDLTIDNGSSLQQNYSGASAPLTVSRHVTINGSLSLGSSTGGDITAGGNWTRNSGGIFNNNGLNVTFNGSANSVITAPSSVARDANGAFGGETFYNININKTLASNSVSLGSNISVINELKLTKGIFDLVNSDVAIISSSSNTAHVAAIPSSETEVRYGGSGGTGTGKFIIQRQLQIGAGSTSRRWRLLTAPLQATGAPTINAAWQEGVSNANRNSPVDPWPGFGTTITKSTVYNAADGYDQGSTNNPSIYYYSPAAVWTAPASTTAAITDKEGYMLFARGDRSIVVSTPSISATPTILEPKGRINVGNVQKTLTTGLQVIGSPYASAIDFGKATFNNYTSGGSTYNNTTAAAAGGLGITYYIFDPRTSGTSGVGKFISCSSNGDGTFAVSGNTSGLPTNGTIQSGTAFLIGADNSGGTITFHETDKLTSSSTTGIASSPLTYADPIASLTTNLFAGSGADASLADGVINAYHANYQNALNAQDARKINSFNSREALSIARDNSSLVIERRNRITANDTIFLNIENMNATAYSFQFIAKNLNPAIFAVLEDKFTGVAKVINLTDTSVIYFKITADANSAKPDRFHILLQTTATLAVKFNNIKATRQNNNIEIQWTVGDETGIKEYEVEKSADGRMFNNVNITSLKSNNATGNTYMWIDEKALPGKNFYRIKSISTDGRFEYSKIVKVVFEYSRPAISVYQNPVIDRNIKLRFHNMPAGNYQVKIINTSGQIISRTALKHNGGSAVQTIVPVAKLPMGTYQVEVNKNDKMYILKFLIK